jgi:hypothetical protein
MDVMSFLKMVPAVIGIAGLLTYFMRARAPVSDHELVLVVQRVRNTFLLLGCAALIMLSAWLIFRPAPPDHDAALPIPTTIGNAGTPAKALVRSDGVSWTGSIGHGSSSRRPDTLARFDTGHMLRMSFGAGRNSSTRHFRLARRQDRDARARTGMRSRPVNS